MENSAFRWLALLRNPIWYVVVVTALTALTTYARVLWWLVGVVAVIWGVWLIWPSLGWEEVQSDGTEPLDAYLDQARVYHLQISRLLQATANKSNTVERQRLLRELNGWVRAIQALGQHVTSLRTNELLCRDMAAVPQALADIQGRLESETDRAVQIELTRALNNRRHQLASLKLLERILMQSEIQIEVTLSWLGTIYSQLLTGQSTRHMADYDRFSVEINEEVQRLQEQLEALREVKAAQRPYAAGPPFQQGVKLPAELLL